MSPVSAGGRIQQGVSVACLPQVPHGLAPSPPQGPGEATCASPTAAPLRSAQFHQQSALTQQLFSCPRRGGFDPNMVHKNLMVLSSWRGLDWLLWV